MMNNNIEIKFIEWGSLEYEKELELRDEVLRKPLDMSIYDEDIEVEKGYFHIGAYLNKELVGVLCLVPVNDSDIKMRQVAVDEKARQGGIGSSLVKFSETFAKEKGFKKIVLDARKIAVGFYEKQGYLKDGSEFVHIDIPHFKMYKNI